MDRYPVLADTRPARRIYVDDAPPPTRSRLLPWLVGIGLVLLVGSFALAWFALASPVPAGAPAAGNEDRTEVRHPVAVAHVDVEGGVRYLYPTQHGRVVSLPVAEDVAVDKGTELLKVDDRLQQAQLVEARLELKAAQQRLHQARLLVKQHEKKVLAQQAAVDAARAKLAAAEIQADKLERLFKQNKAGSKEAVDVARTQVAEAQAGVRAEQAKLELIRSMNPDTAVELASLDVEAKRKQVDKATLAVEECVVRAPVRGKVLRRLVSEGEALGPNPKQPALIFCPEGKRIVRAEVEQEFARTLVKGMAARITDDTRTKEEWTGKIQHISDWYSPRRSVLLEPMQFNDIRTLEVIIEVTDSKPGLRIGQRVHVKLEPVKD